MNFFGKKQQDQLEQRLAKHQGTAGLSTRNLEFGVWYIQHRRSFFIATIIILALIALQLWGFSLYYFGNYVLKGITVQKNTLIGLSQNNLLHNKVDYNQNIRQKFVKVISLGSNRYDLIGYITNANENMIISFDYYYVVAGQKTKPQSSFAFPNEKKILLSLNQQLSGQVLSASLIIDNLQFQRLDNHKIPDWTEYKLDYLNFAVKDEVFAGSEQSGLTENLKLNRLSFSINNQTSYGYYEVPLNIIVYNKDKIVAVTRYLLNNFKSRENRLVNISLLGYIPQATGIEVMTDLNILDNSVFMPIQ